MKKSYYILLGLLTYLSPIFGQSDADTVTSASEQTPAKIVTINTSAGILKAKLYDDVPNHVRTLSNAPNEANTTERYSLAYSRNL